MQQAFTLQQVTGATEVLITPSNARLIAIVPQGAATGTVTVREASAIGSGNAARWVAPATGSDFKTSWGVAFAGGLTVQLSVGGDTFGIVWGPRL
jgi:hypothetical protein